MFGRTGELERLAQDRKDYSLPKIVRQRADKAHATIVKQMKDSHLMHLRLMLIGAVKAGDEKYMEKIQYQMRDYLREDKETGL